MLHKLKIALILKAAMILKVVIILIVAIILKVVIILKLVTILMVQIILKVATSLSDGSYFGEICLLTNARSPSPSHLIYVIFCTPPYFWACKLYCGKVCKFAKQIASRQNSEN